MVNMKTGSSNRPEQPDGKAERTANTLPMFNTSPSLTKTFSGKKIARSR
jgi:hypothetical protein